VQTGTTIPVEALSKATSGRHPGPNERRAAKIAALAFLLTLPLLVYAFFGIQVPLIVAGPAETAQNILANESLFRVSIVCYLIYSAGLLTQITALYETLKTVHSMLALLAAAWRLIFALMWVRATLNLLDALLTLKVDYLRVFQVEELQALTKVRLAASFDQYYVGLLFWGLASTICCYLWLRSRYIPRALSVFGLLSSLWAIFCTSAFILKPDFTNVVNLWWFDSPIGLFEAGLSFWLLFKGLVPSAAIARPELSET
jgi:uncharacterized Tic20 family protein